MKDPWNYGEPYESYPIDTARLRKVVELVAEKGEWGRSVPKGHGLGIAAHRSFVSYVATIIEVAVDEKGKLTVPRVDTAIDCGTYVNPERPATATRPSGPEQTSIPNNAPPASRTNTTGQVNQDPMVKQMNDKEKGKVEREGK